MVTGLDRLFRTRCEYIRVRLPSAVPADDSPDKSAGSRFGRPKDARRGHAMDGVNQKPIQTCEQDAL